MHRFAFTVLFLASTATAVAATGPAGSATPFSNLQPSLGLNYLVRSNSATFSDVGEITLFAGNFAPAGWLFADGSSVSTATYDRLFTQIGTTYGGNGTSNFNLPDLRGRLAVGAGDGPDTAPLTLGQSLGTDPVTLTTAQMPAHSHTYFTGGTTSVTGGSQPFSNMQPSLVVNYTVSLTGAFPPRDSGSTPIPFYAQVRAYAGSTVPAGQHAADGTILPINQNQALFALLGTNFGGDGRVNFALPDLRGRAVIDVADNAAVPAGHTSGAESVTLAESQLPAHTHSLPAGGSTDPDGGSQPFSDTQPSLSLNYIICRTGIFPDRDSDPTLTGGQPFLGQITLFAGNYAPAGWSFCDGTLLHINQDQALFALLGTTYGGDGRSTFALPDLRNLTPIGAGTSVNLGQVVGTDLLSLTESNLPTHTHDLLPEPTSLATLGLAITTLFPRRRTSRPQ